METNRVTEEWAGLYLMSEQRPLRGPEQSGSSLHLLSSCTPSFTHLASACITARK